MTTTTPCSATTTSLPICTPGADAIGRLSVARETVFSNLTTAVSVFAGVALLGEPFSWLGLLFVLLILAGIWGVQRTAK